jgi:hypothetical protein
VDVSVSYGFETVSHPSAPPASMQAVFALRQLQGTIGKRFDYDALQLDQPKSPCPAERKSETDRRLFCAC